MALREEHEMTAPHRGWTDQQLDQLIGNLLRAGVLLAAAIIFVGAVLYFVQSGSAHPDYAQFKGEPAALERITDIAIGAWHLEGKSVIQFGLLLLLATPVARVALLVLAFGMQRDWFYVLVSAVVLAVLLWSVAGVGIP
jgi:uncharacterized membrane protein